MTWQYPEGFQWLTSHLNLRQSFWRALELFVQSKTNQTWIFYMVCHRHPTRKVMDCFSSSNITDNFCHINDAKCHSNIFKILTQCHPSRASECKCKLLLYNLHSSGISRKNQMLSRVCYFIE